MRPGVISYVGEKHGSVFFWVSCAYRNRRIWIVSTPTYTVTHVSSVALDTCAPHTGTGVSGPFRGHELKYRGPREGISPAGRMQVPSFSFSALLIPLPSADPAQPHSFPERQPSPRECPFPHRGSHPIVGTRQGRTCPVGSQTPWRTGQDVQNPASPQARPAPLIAFKECGWRV